MASSSNDSPQATQAYLQRAENLWDQNKAGLPYPKGRVPKGAETTRLLDHHYNYWHEMFAPRQLLALATLLDGLMAEKDDKLREMLLCAFSNTLEGKQSICTQHSITGDPGWNSTGRHICHVMTISPK